MKILSNTAKEPEPVGTFKLTKKCFQDIHSVDKNRTSERLRKQSGWLARLRYYLFEKPLRSHFHLLIGFLILLFLGGFIVRLVDNAIIKAISFIVLSLLYFWISIFLYLITPSPDMDYDERWSKNINRIKKVLGEDRQHLSKQENLKYIKRRIQKSINHYRRNGEPTKFVVDLMWGGVFIGCLTDTKFQKALLFFPDIPKIWDANPFGMIALMSILFIGPIYHFKYRIPKIWIEQVIAQIELDE